MSLNPFVWSDVIDPSEAVPRGEFTARAANTLKAGTHLALFGPRGTGKTTFIGQLAEELALDHGADAPSWEVIRIDLRRRAISPGHVRRQPSMVQANNPAGTAQMFSLRSRTSRVATMPRP
jgi:ABC-type Mn2+/Zn2+ transport system ATPase subunit